MLGFKMAVGGAGRGRGRGAAVAPALSCFKEEEKDTAFKGLPAAAPPAPPEPARDAPDPLDAFMAGIEAEVAKESAKPPGKEVVPEPANKAAWDELQTEDPIASYYEAYEKESQKRKKRNTSAAEPNGAAGDDSSSEAGDGEGEADEEEGALDRRSKPIEPLPPIDHSVIEYAAVKTEFYRPHAEIQRLTEDEVAGLRGEMRIAATGSSCPSPVVSFAHLGLPAELMEGIRRHGYVKPTPIQAQAIPAALSGRDVIGIAETGSGKTVAYLMPMLVHCADQPALQKDEGPIGLVLCPTRELAIQIEKETFKFNKSLGLRSTTLAGGLSKYQQFKDLKKGSEIIIATPGRMIDIVKMKGCNLRRCTFLVLDEADRMMNMGFEVQIRSIVQNIRPARQTLLFSATFPPKIERISLDLLRQPIRITVGKLGQAAGNIAQHVEVLASDAEKWPWLAQRVDGWLAEGQLLIFVKSKQAAVDLAKSFDEELRRGTAVLHGDLEQDERMRVMDSFRKSKAEVLIATDLAARGLDISSIRNVVSYDVARDIETHTHRVGRTGRAGERGDAHTLLVAESRCRKMAALLVEHLEDVGSPISEGLLGLAMKHPPFRASRLVAKPKRAAPSVGKQPAPAGSPAAASPGAVGAEADVEANAEGVPQAGGRKRPRSTSPSPPPTP